VPQEGGKGSMRFSGNTVRIEKTPSSMRDLVVFWERGKTIAQAQEKRKEKKTRKRTHGRIMRGERG